MVLVTSALEDKTLSVEIKGINCLMLDVNRKLPEKGLKRILIRGTNWIGDAILTLPAIDSIRATYPEAHMAILAKPWLADVYRIFGAADEVMIYEKTDDNAWGVFRLAQRLRERRFDAAILLQNAIEAAIIARFAGIPVRAGYDSDGRGILLTHRVRRTKEIKKAHQVDYYLGMVEALGCVSIDKEMQLKTKIDSLAAQDILRKYTAGNQKPVVGIAPGATYGPAKKWFPARFAAVADRITNILNCRVIILGGKSDADAAAEVCKCARTEITNLAGRTDLKEAIHLISQCRLFISNDSGLMHIAGALEIPTIAIFGSTNPETTSPMGKQSLVIRREVSCSPCLKKTCPTDFRCMELISVDDVFNAAGNLLKNYPGKCI
jgi:heptosyltransferase II